MHEINMDWQSVSPGNQKVTATVWLEIADRDPRTITAAKFHTVEGCAEPLPYTGKRKKKWSKRRGSRIIPTREPVPLFERIVPRRFDRRSIVEIRQVRDGWTFDCIGYERENYVTHIHTRAQLGPNCLCTDVWRRTRIVRSTHLSWEKKFWHIESGRSLVRLSDVLITDARLSFIYGESRTVSRLLARVSHPAFIGIFKVCRYNTNV